MSAHCSDDATLQASRKRDASDDDMDHASFSDASYDQSANGRQASDAAGAGLGEPRYAIVEVIAL